jgi:hypothetical protein
VLRTDAQGESYALPHWLAVGGPADRPRYPLPDFSLIVALYDGRRCIEADRAAATLLAELPAESDIKGLSETLHSSRVGPAVAIQHGLYT